MGTCWDWWRSFSDHTHAWFAMVTYICLKEHEYVDYSCLEKHLQTSVYFPQLELSVCLQFSLLLLETSLLLKDWGRWYFYHFRQNMAPMVRLSTILIFNTFKMARLNISSVEMQTFSQFLFNNCCRYSDRIKSTWSKADSVQCCDGPLLIVSQVLRTSP